MKPEENNGMIPIASIGPESHAQLGGAKEPFVSVVLLNCNRFDALQQCLASVVAQTYSNMEIIVVDNHSDEDVSEVINHFDREIRLIRLESNLGACGGRNRGIRAARGEIVVTIDNDVVFLTEHELQNIVDTFSLHPQYQVVAFRICDKDTGRIRLREWCHPRDWNRYGDVDFETDYFCEGMCAFRREVFSVAGLYYEPLFVYCEGWDFGLRILNAGFRILYAPSIQVAHLMAGGSRLSSWNFYLFTRNYCWIAYRDYPFFAGITFLVPKLAMMLLFALKNRELAAFAKGLRAGIGILRQPDRTRTPISTDTVRYLRQIEKQRPSLWQRLGKHRDGTKL